MNEKIRNSKFISPSLKIPAYELMDASLITAIGKTKHLTVSGTENFIFGIKRKDRIYPLYILGKRGVGKTKLIEILIRQDIFYNYGFCYFDFRGENFYNLLNFIPKDRIDNVCIIDLNKTSNFIFNPFKNILKDFQSIFIKDLVNLFKSFFKDYWNYEYEILFYNSFLTLLNYSLFKLSDLYFFFKDSNFRNKILSYIKNKELLNYWQKEFVSFSRGNNFNYLLSKLHYLLINSVFCNIFNHSENKINFNQLIKDKSIILININKVKFQEDLVNFISSLFLLKLKEVGFYRSYMKSENKELFYLYLDNFYYFNESLVSDFLKNFNYYNFSLNLSHQYLSQVSEEMKNLIFSNCGHFIFFKLTGDDALEIKKELGSVLELKDFVNLNLKEFYAKITVDNEMQDVFFAETLKVLPLKEKKSYKNLVISKSKEKYG